jgi:hypothetical protein
LKTRPVPATGNQASGVGVEGEVADLVDDQQRVAVEQARLARLERR